MKITQTTVITGSPESYTASPLANDCCAIEVIASSQTLAQTKDAINRHVAALIRNDHAQLISLKRGETVKGELKASHLNWKYPQMPPQIDWWNHLNDWLIEDWKTIPCITEQSPGGAPLYEIAYYHGFLHLIDPTEMTATMADSQDGRLETFLRCLPDTGRYEHLMPKTGQLILTTSLSIQRKNLVKKTMLPYFKLDVSQRHRQREKYPPGSLGHQQLIAETIQWGDRKRPPARCAQFLFELLPTAAEPLQAAIAEIPEPILLAMETNAPPTFLRLRECLDPEKWRRTAQYPQDHNIENIVYYAQHTGGTTWKPLFTFGIDLFEKHGAKLTGWHNPETAEEILDRAAGQNHNNPSYYKFYSKPPPIWLAKILLLHPKRFAKGRHAAFFGRCAEVIV